MDIEFTDLKLKLRTRIFFEEGTSAIRIERSIMEMSDPLAVVGLDEYMVACYGTTEYTEDMSGIMLSATKGGDTVSVSYEYKCREKHLPGADCVSALVPQIGTKVSMRCDHHSATGYFIEGYAFSPMFTLGYTAQIRDKEVITTWLSLEKAD